MITVVDSKQYVIAGKYKVKAPVGAIITNDTRKVLIGYKGLLFIVSKYHRAKTAHKQA